MDFMTGLKRTDYCGVLTMKDVGREVTVAGWVQRQRDLGALIFVDLRDRTGFGNRKMRKAAPIRPEGADAQHLCGLHRVLCH